MTDIFDAIEKEQNEFLNSLQDATAWAPSEQVTRLQAQAKELSNNWGLIVRSFSKNVEALNEKYWGRLQANYSLFADASDALSSFQSQAGLYTSWERYWQDAQQRFLLTLDLLRQRGDIFIEHEENGCPPVLIYDYDLILDGADLPRPSCYVLLKIKPLAEEERNATQSWKRPYIIIDPRAGHGAGIGGFKPDSQVGVALRDGHPVYFVAFKRTPEKSQTLADVTACEAAFVRKVMELHPDAPKPIVTGNCQGGWATLLLAALNPDITGPIVLNGAPVATWSGRVGENPMRYNAGILGGTWHTMFSSDLGHGVFDSADIVQNFEMLNPSRTYFRKYYDLYSKIDTEAERFLEFERWWDGYFLLNEAEIKWIVEQLFVGNRLSKNEAQIEPGRSVDIKKIQAPIIVFASWGDNITPPQQALNWILDTYANEREIAIRGQRIIYMIHDQVGHLGIFVSSKIAQKEHAEVTSTLKTIEALPPGLYEMTIDEFDGTLLEREFTVSFHERSLEDLTQIDDGRDDEVAFAAVARLSEQQAEFYDVFMRPLVQASVTAQSAELRRRLHPLRIQRATISSLNPWLGFLPSLSERARSSRVELEENNPFLQIENANAACVEQTLNTYRDLRDAAYEMMFYGIWGSPYMRWFGRTHQTSRTLKCKDELRNLQPVRAALMHIEAGGFCEAVVRMLILLAESRGNVRKDRLERSAKVLTQDEPFNSLSTEKRSFILQEQTLIVDFDPQKAVEALPKMLKAKKEREKASNVVRYIVGPVDEMAPHTLKLLQRFHEILGLPPFSGDMTSDPLSLGTKVNAA